MKSSAFYAIIGAGVLLVIGIVWWGVGHKSAPPTAAHQATSTQQTNTPPLTGLSIYTNGQYGFSLMYPASDKTEAAFDTYYHLPSTWRVNALANATGTPVIAVVGYTVTNATRFRVTLQPKCV